MSLLVSALTAVLAVGLPLGGVDGQDVTVKESFQAADERPTPQAVTFDPEAVPVGGEVTVTERVGRDVTRVELRLDGVEANRTFGAHVHQKPCGSEPNASGPHYQNTADPKQPSTDPKYANPHNEVWLDITTDRDGRGTSASTTSWQFRDGGARSVVIHDHATHTAPGEAGTAGARLACVNVSFK
ncbi:superoxide dismutase family protein [Streptomyces sp. RerS4]|uniref:superoxide dismutase family protein n=1 Tax=Streptomyces sp. RerS4 TaxID=2942449 RepID=UPI00201CADF9|nr:superoxide dismutase family protein [Streptomyces sp. RerS4]UQW99393.1 superoxide dismutase family protein [Streptomyces sp. RerS4]